jgi:hypothetical protein
VSDAGNGSVDVAIGVFEGKVVASWHEPVAEISFDPKNAYTIGMHLARAAMEAHQGRATGKEFEFIAGELAEVKVKVSDVQRMAMVMKVSTIVRSLIDQKRSAGYIAQHCVDAVLQDTAR